MENIENNELLPARKAKKVELTSLEGQIQSRRNDLNFPALQSMFELKEDELQAILDKLPPADCTTC
jgi:hypothetical protein